MKNLNTLISFNPIQDKNDAREDNNNDAILDKNDVKYDRHQNNQGENGDINVIIDNELFNAFSNSDEMDFEQYINNNRVYYNLYYFYYDLDKLYETTEFIRDK